MRLGSTENPTVGKPTVTLPSIDLDKAGDRQGEEVGATVAPTSSAGHIRSG